jgi:hypothetical protein
MRVIAAIALVLLLGGCVPAPPAETPAPTPGPTPVFASEEEALAAAEEAYAAYQAATDSITQAGGLDGSPLRSLVTEEQYARELEGLESFAATGWHTSGNSTFDSMSIQSYEDSTLALITVYVCSDVTGVRLIDGSGVDVTPLTRSNRLPLVVSFESSVDRSSLLVAESDVWDGGDVCAP